MKHLALHKFGGTSLCDKEAYARAAKIVREDSSAAIVVSAMAGVTDALLSLVEQAVAKTDYAAEIEKLKKKHLEVAAFFGSEETFLQAFESDEKDIQDILRGLHVTGQSSETIREIVSGYGEIWSAQLMAKAVEGDWLNARETLFIQRAETGPAILWKKSSEQLQKILPGKKTSHLVITGYVASNEDGTPTTLKRNGSDFSASIFAKLLDVPKLTIWTDVDGVMSADPRKVPGAFVIDQLSYSEAMELAFFGAKVLHPKTMSPIIEKKIPLWIRNSKAPEKPGTCICENPSETGTPAKGFASIENVALVNVEGTGLLGVPGIAERLFGAVKEAGVSVIMISQASSEHSICFAVPEAHSEMARQAVQRVFFFELEHGQLQAIDIQMGCAILAVVGDKMVSRRGVSATFFSALAKAGVNIRAIAQGSSERNISVVVDQSHAIRALRASHSGFYLSRKTLSIGLIGPGLIGKTLLEQISKQKEVLKEKHQIDIRVRGICNSKKMILDEENADLYDLESGEAADLKKFATHIRSDHIPHAVIVDCTSSEAISEKYLSWLSQRIHIVTPNKKANSSDYDLYRDLKSENDSFYLYETTVGAGLPIITTLKDLMQTGDEIDRIEGIFSGTLSYIFNRFSVEDKKFSEIVAEAKANGFTEPDPRDDLSGMDVARKVVILARESGQSVSTSDFEIENLVPQNLGGDLSVEDFMSRLDEMDSEMEKLKAEAEKEDAVLRYVGIIEKNSCFAGLRKYPKDHSFVHISGSDNIISFTTGRYQKQPLVIKGPGAGPEVTAAGVFADLIRLGSFLEGHR